jgi:hypothetical protein
VKNFFISIARHKNLMILYGVSLFIAISLSFVIDQQIPPYRLYPERYHDLIRAEGSKIFFHDLNSDKAHEIILNRKNMLANNALNLYQPDLKSIDQINFPDELIHNSLLFFSDIDGDSLKEINVFTFRRDSVFLSSVEFSTLEKPDDRVFISKAEKVNGSEDFFAGPGYGADMDLDGKEELVFVLNSLFSDKYRKIFIYDPDDDDICGYSD